MIIEQRARKYLDNFSTLLFLDALIEFQVQLLLNTKLANYCIYIHIYLEDFYERSLRVSIIYFFLSAFSAWRENT